MTGPALIVFRDQRNQAFEADDARLEVGAVVATGRLRSRVGANCREVRYHSGRVTRTFPLRDVQVRWAEEMAA
jgi:hypothetical protein